MNEELLAEVLERLGKMIDALIAERDWLADALKRSRRANAMGIGTHGDSCPGGDCEALREFREDIAAANAALAAGRK